MEKITEYLIKPTLSEKGIVKVWKETIKLPTYEIGEEEKKSHLSGKARLSRKFRSSLPLSCRRKDMRREKRKRLSGLLPRERIP